MSRYQLFKRWTCMAFMLVLLPVLALAEEQETDRHIIFLVDFSGSVKANLPNYWKTIGVVTGCTSDMEVTGSRICEKIRPKDKIILVKITGESRRKAEIIADIYFPKRHWNTGKSMFRKMMLPKRTNFRDDIRRAFSNPTLAKDTEILGAIRLAQQYFEGVKAKKNMLIILSDMIEESEFYNFKRNTVCPKAILENEEKNGRLPDLAGIKVYISGASAESAKKFDEVKRFWVAYFDKTGATFAERDYYPSELLDFPE
jgi:hypothetical protein